MKTIYKKLANIQQELQAPKSQYNSFGKYSYRSCEDILSALKPLLAKNGAIIHIADEIVEVGGRVYVKATASLIDIETGEQMQTTAYAREQEQKTGADASQITGASSSYARKYALNGLLAIDDTKDADATNTHDKGKNGANKGKATPAPAPAPTASAPVCANCGQVIVASDGYTAEQIAQNTAKACGKPLCKACYSQVRKQQKETR